MLDNDEMYFNISQVAKLIGVTAATIRNWEKHNLITPERAKNGYRIFSLRDLEILKEISSFSKQGAPIKNILFSLYPKILNANKSAETIIPKRLLGTKWKNNRLTLGLSIDQVASKTGISPSYIYKIENAQTKNVSFDILQKLASFYGGNILSYYDDHPANVLPYVKKGSGEIITVALEGVSLESLTRAPDNQLTGMIYTIKPGFGRLEASFHNGEEIVYVLSGTLDFYLEDKCYSLHKGDSLHFKSHLRHKWINKGEQETKLFWVHTASSSKK